MVDVYMDDIYVGTVEKPKEFIKLIREERRTGKLPFHLNISYDKNFNEIFIDLSKGRARRPLIVVENGAPKLTSEKLMKLNSGEISWKELIDQGIIEYLDAAEEENSYISLYESELTKDHTHLEISPVTILGICTSIIPYSNFGGSSRLIRGSKIQKQSIGMYASNFLYRMDTDTSILHYPQVPIVNTFMHSIYNFKAHPSGQNVVIAMISFQGYNMQDAIIINKGSVERGFGRSSYFRPYNSEELRYSGGLTDEVTIPDKEVKGYKSEKDYRLLEKDGIVYTGANVKEDDVVIGKTSPPRFLGELEEFSIAANIPEEDVPFTSRGVRPDILFSPHSIPGRMTISHLIEILAGKVGSLKGEHIDGTTFDAVPEEQLRKELAKLGFRENCTETMYNAITGEQFKAKIYIGSIYYLKLKHMVANKLHARASGRIQLLTRQPIEGRAKGGGLRIGEMEKD